MQNTTKNKPYLIGITGSFGTGKSTAGNILKDLGILVIDTDKIVRDILKTNNKTTETIIKEFGSSIKNQNTDEPINKKALAKIIFNDKNKRTKLESIIHPEVNKTVKSLINSNDDKEIIAVLIPLLFECNLESNYNETWCITCKESVQLKRLEEKGIPKDESMLRISAQLPLNVKASKADFVVDNSNDLKSTKEQVLKRLKELAQSNHNLHLSFDK